MACQQIQTQETKETKTGKSQNPYLSSIINSCTSSQTLLTVSGACGMYLSNVYLPLITFSTDSFVLYAQQTLSLIKMSQEPVTLYNWWSFGF